MQSEFFFAMLVGMPVGTPAGMLVGMLVPWLMPLGLHAECFSECGLDCGLKLRAVEPVLHASWVLLVRFAGELAECLLDVGWDADEYVSANVRVRAAVLPHLCAQASHAALSPFLQSGGT